jgi:hypothetical protein
MIVTWSRVVGAVAFLSMLGASIGSCAGGSAAEGPPTPTPAPATVMILHTNDNWGETKPCG